MCKIYEKIQPYILNSIEANSLLTENLFSEKKEIALLAAYVLSAEKILFELHLEK